MSSAQLAAAFAIACAVACPALAQNTSPAKPPAAVKPTPAAAPTKAAAEAQPADTKPPAEIPLDAPGANHQHLQKLAGEWDCTVRSNFTGTWTESKATVKSHVRMGGRFLVANFQGDFNGVPMNGQQILGYNNLSKQFESVWRDNISTGMMIEFGTADAAGKVITTRGECEGPGGEAMKSKTVITIADKRYSVQTYQLGADDKETLVFEMKCTQTKAPGKGAGEADEDDVQGAVKGKARGVRDSAKPK
jgi:hypothetical protein